MANKRDIKRALQHCKKAQGGLRNCEGCPYTPHNCEALMSDALDLIEHLEAVAGDNYKPMPPRQPLKTNTLKA